MARNPAATVFVGNLDPKVTERILYNLMQQAGPLVDVYIPRDKDKQQEGGPEQDQFSPPKHRGYGFAEYDTEESAEYAVKLFSGTVRLFNRQVRFQISTSGRPATAPAASGNGAAVHESDSPPTFRHSSAATAADDFDHEHTALDPMKMWPQHAAAAAYFQQQQILLQHQRLHYAVGHDQHHFQYHYQQHQALSAQQQQQQQQQHALLRHSLQQHVFSVADRGILNYPLAYAPASYAPVLPSTTVHYSAR